MRSQLQTCCAYCKADGCSASCTAKASRCSRKTDAAAPETTQPSTSQGSLYTSASPAPTRSFRGGCGQDTWKDFPLAQSLDWKVSIVDLLKLLDIDSSREARNELATELGCPADLMKDSAKMNVWLHKEVLKQIAENGGNIPRQSFGLKNQLS